MGKEPLEETTHFSQGLRLLSDDEQEAVFRTLELYMGHPYHESLRNHPLRESDPRIRSISVIHDLRIILRDRGDGTILLLDVGDHERVYRRTSL